MRHNLYLATTHPSNNVNSSSDALIGEQAACIAKYTVWYLI